MKKLREKIHEAEDFIEDKLRQICGKISPEKRLVIVLVAFVIFAAFSIYIIISSIYRFGKEDGMKIQLQHIEPLNLKYQPSHLEQDSVIIDYENDERITK